MADTKIALIVGAASGIGAATARRLARDGYCLALADLADGPLLEVARETGALAFTVDIADADCVAALFDAVEAALGPVTILINTAAISPMKPGGGMLGMADAAPELLRRVIDVNVMGALWLGREYALRASRAAPGGRVVMLSSSAARLGGMRSAVVYSASKGAIQSFVKGLARELAPQGITVNCVAPGLVDTPMLRAGLDPADDEAASGTVPLGRIGTADEMANAIAWLVSDQAAYMTGATLDVNGGYHML